MIQEQIISYGTKGKSFFLYFKPYFCGQHPDCTILGSRWALNKALYNIESFYPVVGVLENMNSTLTVLQKKLPVFFRDVVSLYRNKLKGKYIRNSQFKTACRLIFRGSTF